MASPRTMFSGAIGLGLVTLPITIGKASAETKESSLVEVCDHDGKVVKIDRRERCAICAIEGDGTPKHKAHAVKVADDDYRLLDSSGWNQIEAATKSDLLTIEDVQPLDKLPMMYTIGTYYVRHNDKAKGASDDAFAHFVAALHKTRSGAIVKWGNSSRQKLCVLMVESGVLLLRVIPFVTDIRVASKMERAHWKCDLDERKLDKMTSFLSEVSNPNGFDYASYSDEGLKLRQTAVDAVLSGEEPKQLPKMEESSEPIDWMSKLEETIKLQKEKV